MKKITQLLLLVILLLGGGLASAATVTITVADFTFSPKNVTINPGDVIQFQWSSGTHTSTADNNQWNFTITSAAPTHTLSNLASGTYPYHCTFHGGAGGVGMAGTITVRTVSGIKDNLSPLMFNAYPNPSSGPVTITLTPGTSDNYKVYVSNVVGSIVKSIDVNEDLGEQKIQVDLTSLPSGLYFCTLLENGKMIETRRLVVRRQ